jgi:hypothetical protein
MKRLFTTWGIPIIIGLILFIFGKTIIHYCTTELIYLYYKSIGHPSKYDETVTGSIGDTFGGTAGPMIALIASYLTFLAFWVQLRANEQQKRDLKIERFESKFYKLIEIHRNNVSEITIRHITGRKAFISMFNELKFTYLTIDKYNNENHKINFPEHDISQEIIFDLSYLIFFFGVGHNSSKIIIDLLGGKEEHRYFFTNLEVYLAKIQTDWRVERKKGNPIHTDNGKISFDLNIYYKPFDGHMSRLSHYIRHLFQLVKYVDDAESNLFSHQDKYDYISTLRAQLSTHEQLLLYYNAISVLGKPWIDENYLKNYCIVKSLPLPLADFYKLPIDVLGEKNIDGKVMFEWLEIKARLNKK